MRCFNVLTMALGASVALAGPAGAVAVLDQSSFTADPAVTSITYTGMLPTGYPVHQTQLQTITAGMTGQLTRIDLKVQQDFGSGMMQLDLFQGGYVPGQAASDYHSDGWVFFSNATLPQNPGSGFATTPTQTVTSFDLSALNFYVTAGQTFSFSVRSAESYGTINSVTLASTNVDYAGGKDYLSSNIGLRYLDYNEPDVQFQTFVDGVSPAPEPASWALLVGGFGMIGGAVRARRLHRLA